MTGAASSTGSSIKLAGVPREVKIQLIKQSFVDKNIFCDNSALGRNQSSGPGFRLSRSVMRPMKELYRRRGLCFLACTQHSIGIWACTSLVQGSGLVLAYGTTVLVMSYMSSSSIESTHGKKSGHEEYSSQLRRRRCEVYSDNTPHRSMQACRSVIESL